MTTTKILSPLWLGLIVVLALTPQSIAQESYDQPWRPQYHFPPKGYFVASSIAFISSADSDISAAFMFSSRCATDEVPGIGKITGL